MTLEEAIKHLEDTLSNPAHAWNCESCKDEHKQLLDWLLELQSVRTKREQDRNAPLTLDELAAMDGMPIGVEFEPDVTGEQLTMWALVEATDTIMLTNNLRGRSELLDDMTVEGWQVKVYHRPPDKRDGYVRCLD